MDAVGYPIARTERRLVAVQLAIAAVIGVGAWVARIRLEELERPAEDIEFVALLFHPSLWIGLFLFAISYLLIAAALGYAAGTLAAVGWLVSGKAGERRRVVLMGVPVVMAALFVVVALVIV